MFHAAALLIASLTGVASEPPQHTAARSTMEARGSFEVKVEPHAGIPGPVGVLTLTKTYQGDLQATATGQMLGQGDPAGKTASYVAIEQVTGTIAGRRGSFVLQHRGWMHDGKQEMTVTIAPGSGTGALAGISGTLEIVVEGKEHRYVLRYELP